MTPLTAANAELTTQDLLGQANVMHAAGISEPANLAATCYLNGLGLCIVEHFIVGFNVPPLNAVDLAKAYLKEVCHLPEMVYHGC